LHYLSNYPIIMNNHSTSPNLNSRPMQTWGKYEVRYLTEVVPLHVLEDALLFFENIDEAATLWDVSALPYIIKSSSKLL